MSISQKLQPSNSNNNNSDNNLNNKTQKLNGGNNTNYKTNLEFFIKQVQEYIDKEYDKCAELEYPITLYKDIDNNMLKKIICPNIYKRAYDILEKTLSKFNYTITDITTIELIFKNLLNEFTKNTEFHRAVFKNLETMIKNQFLNEYSDNIIKEFAEFEFNTVKFITDKRINISNKELDISKFKRTNLWDIYKPVLMSRAEITLTFYYTGLLNYILYHYLEYYTDNTKIKIKSSSKNWFQAIVRYNIITKSKINELLYEYVFKPNSNYGLYFLIRTIQDEFNNALSRYQTLIFKVYKNNPYFSDKLLLLQSIKYFITSTFFRDNYFKVRKLVLYTRVMYNNSLRNLLFTIPTPEIKDDSKDNTDRYIKWKYMVFDGSTLQFDILNTNLNNITEEQDNINEGRYTNDIDEIDDIFDFNKNISSIIRVQNNDLIKLYALYKQYTLNNYNNDNSDEFVDNLNDLEKSYSHYIHYKLSLDNSINLRRNVSLYTSALETLITRLSIDIDTGLRRIKKQNIDELLDIHVYIEPVINSLWLFDRFINLSKNIGNSLFWLSRRPILNIDYIKYINHRTVINTYSTYRNIVTKRKSRFKLTNINEIKTILIELIKYSLQFKISTAEFKNYLTANEYNTLLEKINGYLLQIPKDKTLLKKIEKFISQIANTDNNNIELITDKEKLQIIDYFKRAFNHSVFVIPYVNYIIPIRYINQVTNIDISDLILEYILKNIIQRRLINDKL